jgi:hypothetical protein
MKSPTYRLSYSANLIHKASIMGGRPTKLSSNLVMFEFCNQSRTEHRQCEYEDRINSPKLQKDRIRERVIVRPLSTSNAPTQ